MHPPLDRPHPDCQDAIDELRDCHDNRSLLKIWACNELKLKLDSCFRVEKVKLLNEMNKDMHEKRKREEEAWAEAYGHKLSFDEYLKQDKSYQAELQKSQGRDPSSYQQQSTGGMPS